MTVKLRPHHLLCVLTYVGRGYSQAFINNYDLIVARIGAGEDILIVAGPDDICAPEAVSADAHCHRQGVVDRDQLASESLGKALGQAVVPGQHMMLGEKRAARLRQHFSKGATRAACNGCQWKSLCADIADADYGSAKLHGRGSVLDAEREVSTSQ